jgi:2-hydroxy-3-keto-5-methylthiopentenyl-1-phosphate phosphatase
MNEAVIALVCDFDDTLGPDTISFLLAQNNIPEDEFWPQVYAMVKDSWDPPLAYMHLLLDYSKKGKIDISQKTLASFGKKLKLFPGLPKAFIELKEYVKKQPVLKSARVKLEFYIISGGLEDMIRGNSLSKQVDGIFGSTFAYDKKNKDAIGIKSAISFTEKTRFLYGIHKGISISDMRQRPYKTNDALPDEARRIAFSQMIYLGDGPSDIPSLSTIIRAGGLGIGVSSPHTTFKKGYELARGKRITVGPYTANYKKGSDMRKVLEETILRMGLEIDINHKKHIITAPKVG